MVPHPVISFRQHAVLLHQPQPFLSPGDASRIGRVLAGRLKDLLDRQQYEVIIQVCITTIE